MTAANPDRLAFQPQRPETSPEGKKKPLKKPLMIGSAVLAAGFLIPVTGNLLVNASDGNNSPTPGTNNEGEVTPGSTREPTSEPNQPSAEPSPTDIPTNGEVEPITIEDYRFYDENGNAQTFEQVEEEVKAYSMEYPDGLEFIHGYFDLMNDMVNHFPTEEEVRTNLGKPTGELTKEDYQAAAAIYRTAYDTIYESPSGQVYDAMQGWGHETVGFRYDTMVAGEEPYMMNFDTGVTGTILTVTDNSGESTEPLEYTISVGLPERTIEKDPVWKVPSDIDLDRK